MHRGLALLVMAAFAACSPKAEPTPQPPVSCSEAKQGDPCDGSTPSCADPCRSARPRYARCQDGHWVIGTSICEPPPRPIEAGVDPPPVRENDKVGTACVDDAQCDPFENGNSFCSLDAFTVGPVSPTAVCISVDCDPSLPECERGRGTCVPPGVCLPKCTFTTAGATGCLDKTACFALDGASPTTGTGYCFGGCRTDEDCVSVGAACQRESGLCVTKPTSFSKLLGERCTAADDNKTCACRHDRVTALGYCTQTCRVGEACPADWVCDPGIADGGPAAPNGLAGHCAKPCATDGECASMNARCFAGAGLSKKVCRVANPAL